jgi:hypothetical protein
LPGLFTPQHLIRSNFFDCRFTGKIWATRYDPRPHPPTHAALLNIGGIYITFAFPLQPHPPPPPPLQKLYKNTYFQAVGEGGGGMYIDKNAYDYKIMVSRIYRNNSLPYSELPRHRRISRAYTICCNQICFWPHPLIISPIYDF